MALSLTDRLKRLADRRVTHLATPGARRRAMLDYQILDHGFLRAIWRNFHEVAPGVFRSNQPSPGRLAQFRAMGIRAVLNLRGAKEVSFWQLERAACARLGLVLVDLPLSAAVPVPAETLIELERTFRALPRPFVMHCKSGADRTGIAAALYLLMIEGRPVAEAMRALHWRYVHFRRGEKGVLDRLLETYARAQAETGIGIMDWIRNGYDPVAIARAHTAGWRRVRPALLEPPPPARAVWHIPAPAAGAG